MTLRQKQSTFAALVPELIDHAIALGFEVVIGEVQRTQAQADANAKSGKGIARSLHVEKLAIDLMLFRGGKYLTKTEDYQMLGDFWKTLDPACRWGGDFKTRPDGNHFSYSPDGKRA